MQPSSSSSLHCFCCYSLAKLSGSTDLTKYGLWKEISFQQQHSRLFLKLMTSIRCCFSFVPIKIHLANFNAMELKKKKTTIDWLLFVMG